MRMLVEHWLDRPRRVFIIPVPRVGSPCGSIRRVIFVAVTPKNTSVLLITELRMDHVIPLILYILYFVLGQPHSTYIHHLLGRHQSACELQRSCSEAYLGTVVTSRAWDIMGYWECLLVSRSKSKHVMMHQGGNDYMGCCMIFYVGMLMLASACCWLIWISDTFLIYFCGNWWKPTMRQIKDARWEGTRQYSTLKNLRRQKLCQSLLFWKLSWWGAQWRIFLTPLIEAHHLAVLNSVISDFITCQRFKDSMKFHSYHKFLTNLFLSAPGLCVWRRKLWTVGCAADVTHHRKQHLDTCRWCQNRQSSGSGSLIPKSF